MGTAVWQACVRVGPRTSLNPFIYPISAEEEMSPRAIDWSRYRAEPEIEL